MCGTSVIDAGSLTRYRPSFYARQYEDSILRQIDIEEWERCEAMEQVERESLIVEGVDRA